MMFSNQKSQLISLQAILLGVFLCASFTLKAATKEEAVKAGALYNFTKFSVWPNDVIVGSHFDLCVFGKRKNDGLQALNGKLVTNKSLRLHRNVSDKKLNTCHMVYITKDSKQSKQRVLNKVKNLPILTVGDGANFINTGGMIGFIKNGSHVGFEVNIANVKAAGIHISSQMLKLAKKVEGIN